VDLLPVLSDEVALSNLDGDIELLDEIRVTFLESVPEMIKEISLDSLIKTPNECLKFIHSLKSSAGSIGAERLAAVSMRAEKLIREGEIDKAKPLIDDIQICIKNTVEALNRGIA